MVNREKVQSITETVIAIIKQYNKILGGNIEADYFEPKVISDNNQHWWCYRDLFDKEYYEKNKTLDFDTIYKHIGTCIFNTP